MDNFVGKNLDGRYEIQELIGIGGMAMVYKAYDRIDERVVSIKILKEEFLGDNEFTRRFRNESRAIAVLSHPNIVKVYDVCFGDRLQYIVMEYIDGITLKEYIEQQKVINWKETIFFILQILKALQQAHSKGIIHRDIKPQNIMLLRNGTIKVTDFGIAHFSNGETKTMTNQVIGSVHYIAPEQARGSAIDEKADIYSVGVMMYEMLTGKVPFEADNAVSVAIMQLQSEPRPLRELNIMIPQGLEEITLKAMKKEPNQRYHDAGQMIEALMQFKENPNIHFQYRYFSENTTTKHLDVLSPVQYNNSNEEMILSEDEMVSQERSYAIPIISGIGIAVALFTVIFGIAVFIRNLTSSNINEDIWLPNFVEKSYEEVVQNYQDDFSFVVNYVENDTFAEGTIIAQEPKGDIKNVKKGSRVTLDVCAGVEIITMDDYSGKKAAETTAYLAGKNLKYRIVEVFHDSVEDGIVISTVPGKGEGVRAEDQVLVYVSKGPEKIGEDIPNVVGKSYSEAIDILSKAGFKLASPVYEESNQAKNTVLRQSPADDFAVYGTTVSLTLSNGKNESAESSLEKNIDFTISLPKGGDSDQKVVMNVYDENNVKISSSEKEVLSGTTSVHFSVKGIGSRTVVVLVDGKEYQRMLVDFEKGSIKIVEKSKQ